MRALGGIAIAVVLLSEVARAQTIATREDVVGALNTWAVAYRDRASRTITRNAARTRVAVGPATTIAAAARTVRFGAVELSAAAQTALGFASPSGPAYIAAEVQYDPATAVTSHLLFRLPAGIDPVEEEIEVRASPVLASAEVAMVRMDAAEIGTSALMRCACAATPASCTWTRTNFGGGTTAVTPAPTGFTFGPGTWTGAGCARKACVTRAGPTDHTWPGACPR